jgi:cardiolipin synthase
MNEYGDGGRLSWPWRPDTRARLLWESHEFVPAIIDALELARRHIDMELYLVESGPLFNRFYRALVDAVGRGVRVRLLIDAVGSAALSDHDRERLSDSGVYLRVFNTLRFGHFLEGLIRDHRKLIIVDGRLAYSGGMCISDWYDTTLSGDQVWLDAMAEISGPVVKDCGALFEQSWQLASRGHMREALRWRLKRVREPMAPAPDTREDHVRLCAARGGRHNLLLLTLLRHIRRARREVWLCTPYFFPHRALIHVLCLAAKRGVSVTLTLPGPITDHPALRRAGQYYYQRLLAAGVVVQEFQPRFFHLKAALVDDWVTLGSSNYDRWNLGWNLDANLEFSDPAFRLAMQKRRVAMGKLSTEIRWREWCKRSLWQRWRERFWHWLGTRLLRALRGSRA